MPSHCTGRLASRDGAVLCATITMVVSFPRVEWFINWLDIWRATHQLAEILAPFLMPWYISH